MGGGVGAGTAMARRAEAAAAATGCRKMMMEVMVMSRHGQPAKVGVLSFR